MTTRKGGYRNLTAKDAKSAKKTTTKHKVIFNAIKIGDCVTRLFRTFAFLLTFLRSWRPWRLIICRPRPSFRASRRLIDRLHQPSERFVNRCQSSPFTTLAV